MKSSNLSKSLVTSYSTFHNLIIPILALSQLAQAGFGAFVSSFMNNQLGARKPMVFLLRHFWTMIIFLVLALASKQFRMFTRRETPFIVLTGILGIFLKAQLTSKWRSVTSPFYLALWQPLLPVFVQAATILLGMEKSSIRKTIGMMLCFSAWVAFVVKRNLGKDDVFNYNFFMVVQIVVPGVSNITTKQALGADKIGIFNLSFWINVFGVLSAWFMYTWHYFWNPKDEPYFTLQFQVGLLDCAGIFIFIVVADVFGLACLMFITRTGDVSKAAVYSTLNATWTIIIGMVRQEFEWWIILYLVGIYAGYSLINYDKKVAADKAKRAKVRVRFIRKIDSEYEVLEGKTILLGSDLDDDDFFDRLSKFFNQFTIFRTRGRHRTAESRA